MIFDVLTLFPEFFNSFCSWSIIGRAVNTGLISIHCHNIRDFSLDKHKKVDDYPYGGGPGMVMTPEPIVRALEHIDYRSAKVIYLSPQGTPFQQRKAMELKDCGRLILLAGHYEGVDNRVIEHYVDEEISIGDYVLTGGEIPAMVLIEAISRLIPGVLSSKQSFMEESFSSRFLEFPQYTRPEVFRDHRVPEILLSGNHGEIRKWREKKAIEVTSRKRPDLLKDEDQCHFMREED